MNSPKKHHYVPKGYLMHFTNNQQKLFTLELDSIKKGNLTPYYIAKSPSEVGFMPNLYLLNRKGDFLPRDLKALILDPLYVEREVFKDFEIHIGKIIEWIISYQILDSTRALRLSKFIYFGKTRSPFMRESLKSKAFELIDKITKETIAELNSPDTDLSKIPISKEQLIKATENFNRDMKENPDRLKELHNALLATRVHSKDHIAKSMIEHLLRFRWILYKTDSKNKFITTDNPGFFINTLTRVVENTKFGENFICMLPLNPNHCLVIIHQHYDYEFASNGKRYKKIVPAQTTPDLVKAINEFSISVAYNEIISDNTDSLNKILDLVKEKGGREFP